MKLCHCYPEFEIGTSIHIATSIRIDTVSHFQNAHTNRNQKKKLHTERERRSEFTHWKCNISARENSLSNYYYWFFWIISSRSRSRLIVFVTVSFGNDSMNALKTCRLVWFSCHPNVEIKCFLVLFKLRFRPTLPFKLTKFTTKSLI